MGIFEKNAKLERMDSVLLFDDDDENGYTCNVFEKKGQIDTPRLLLYVYGIYEATQSKGFWICS